MLHAYQILTFDWVQKWMQLDAGSIFVTSSRFLPKHLSPIDIILLTLGLMSVFGFVSPWGIGLVDISIWSLWSLFLARNDVKVESQYEGTIISDHYWNQRAPVTGHICGHTWILKNRSVWKKEFPFKSVTYSPFPSRNPTTTIIMMCWMMKQA